MKSVFAGREAEGGLERVGEVRGAAEAGLGRDFRNRQRLCLEHDAGLDKPLAERFASDCGGEFRRKEAVERPARHGEGVCEL